MAKGLRIHKGFKGGGAAKGLKEGPNKGLKEGTSQRV